MGHITVIWALVVFDLNSSKFFPVVFGVGQAFANSMSLWLIFNFTGIMGTHAQSTCQILGHTHTYIYITIIYFIEYFIYIYIYTIIIIIVCDMQNVDKQV